ncbi:hypothetical protein AB0D08_32225 [Kitasatospora sp. NPDC048540]|uniref:hypothetical protein n=1 Tax=unclassified Kitasatospora TaxID=2633591 RepID=UPI00053B41E6|nr:hypothetical protein [Kitasatospora sp. MBT63]
MESNEPSIISAEAEARTELLKAISAEIRALGRYGGQNHRALLELAHAYALVTGSIGAATAVPAPEQRL